MLCERGEFPRQHLFGADRLERDGNDVDYGPFEAPPVFHRLTRATRSKLGYIEQEVAMARAADAATACYSGDSDILRGLAWLRHAGVFRRPLATILHSLPTRPAETAWTKGVDLAICLSRLTQQQLIERYGRRAELTPVLGWGPDLSFPGYEPLGSEFMVSAGKTNRDIPTLLEALRRTGQSARIYSTAPGLGDVANARVISPRSQGRPLFEFGEVLEDLRRASVVAIPIADPERLTGLSELNDAMALGKPVIVTRSPQFDLDIEAIGCGVWVDHGNADHWTRAIERLASDPAGAAEMGRNGRRFAERAWNNDLFAEGVASAFERLPLRSPRPRPGW